MSSAPAPSSPARRVVVVSERMPQEAARALAAAGFEVRVNGDPTSPDVLLADPLCASASDAAIEQIICARAGALLARVGDGLPGLHEAVMSQAERGLFCAVLAFTGNHLGRASTILGLDRNTCARKARAFGLVDEPSRGRKPRSTKARPAAAKSSGRGRPGKRNR